MTNKTLATQMKDHLDAALAAAQVLDPTAHGLTAEVSKACSDLVSHGKETTRMVALTNLAGVAVDAAINFQTSKWL